MDGALVVSMVSVFIATAALIVAVYQSYLSHIHNKLSVKPLISDSLHRNHGSFEFYYQIKNDGLGTAVIKSFQYIWNGEVIDYDILMKKVKNKLIHGDYYRLSTMGPNSTLAKDESRKLLIFIIREGNQIDVKANRYIQLKNELLVNLRVKIEYESLYEAKFQFETHTSTIESELKLLESK